MEQLNSKVLIRIFVSGAAQSELGLRRWCWVVSLKSFDPRAEEFQDLPAPGEFGKKKGRDAGIGENGRDLGWTDCQKEHVVVWVSGGK